MAKQTLSDKISPLFEKVEQLSKVQRISICAAVFVLLIGAFVGLSYWDKYQTIGKLQANLEAEEKKLEKARANAKMLDSYRKKMADARERFEEVRKALPEKEEIPSLIASISQSGRDAGLDFLLFQPNAEISKDFYAEIPVSISVTGNYHEVAVFFNKVANLSRIVNIDDILIKPQNKESGGDLSTSCTAITYKFIESAPKKNNKKTKKKK
ncbi:MAG: type 4a pilus biogenesis protein PilO [Desulfobacteraceae bacterium]|nr:type 4a pilus biogenesis protein PilO [Desulfobacteraceae bacterium]